MLPLRYKKKLASKLPVGKQFFHSTYKNYQYQKYVKNSEKKLQKLLNSDYNISRPDNYSITLEPTYLCNLFCSMCIHSQLFLSRKEAKELKNKELKTDGLLKILSDLDMKFIGLAGAEIFVRKDIFRILEFMKSKNIRTSLLTNGTLINQKNINELLQYKNIINRILYSIDGPREIHNKIRGHPSAFERTMKAIALTKKHFNLSMCSVILEENIDHLESLIDIAKSQGLSAVTFLWDQRFSQQDLEETKEMLIERFGFSDDNIEISVNIGPEFGFSFEYLKKRITQLISYSYKNNILPNFGPYTWAKYLEDYYFGTAQKNLLLGCEDIANNNFRIDSMGNVVFCVALRVKFGNLTQESLQSLWQQGKLPKLRQQVIKNNMLPICKRCCKTFAYGRN